MKIPYVDLATQHALIKDKLLTAVGSVIDKGEFILSEEVAEFERRFAKICGTRYAVGVNSGTDALILALRALGVGQGDEVITVANSFVTTASCISCVGGRPVFIDVRQDYNMNPSLIEKAITKRTRGLIPVHLTGRPADMTPIMAIARKYNILVIEDCAQAVCAQYKDQKVGSFGNIGCFSLHPLKTLNACGDAGVLTTNDEKTYHTLRILRNNGFTTRDNCEVWSNNSRLDSLQAAMLLVKLEYLEHWTNRRRENAQFYQKRLAGLKQVQLPLDKSYEKSVYHTFVIQAEQRDALKDFLEKNGVGTKIHYPIPIHLQPAAKELGYQQGSFPVIEEQTKRILSLPIYPELSEAGLEYVVKSIYSFYQKEGIS